ncbi:MAG TPA: PAS domain S-box protein [Gammaproteobacteria bacterium]|nr:PAS domain S-box protein [Gammaproteobacteria bacterium]
MEGIVAREETREVVLNYFDGSSRTAIVTDIETPFPDGKLIVSRTDAKGVITHVNQSFVYMSGYSESELIGQPHSILRHPDMPRLAFKDLWETIENGNKWHGYVKNLRKDGGYYWVYATVIPNIRNGELQGYTSVRRKPARKKVENAMAAYVEMLREEQQ